MLVTKKSLNPHLYCQIDVKDNKKFRTLVRSKEFEKKLEELLSNETIFLDTDINYNAYSYLYVEINKERNIDELISQIDIALNAVIECELEVKSVRIYDTVNIPIEYEDITVFCKKPLSLRNIHKFLNCETIYFYNTKFSDGGLGLLKIKNLKTINYTLRNDTPEFLKIIIKYLDSKDLLGCQDELIDNGLSKYAKL